MKSFYFFYAIVSAVIAIGVIIYVCVDIILEKKRHSTNALGEKIEQIAIVVPDHLPEPIEIMPEPVQEIDEEMADILISDQLAMSAVSYERGAGRGFRDIVNIGSIDGVFERNDIVTIDRLKEKGLISAKAKRVKILADGILHKPLTVKAEAFSVQAVKMIELTGGTVVILQV